jgi:hypothetical protein
VSGMTPTLSETEMTEAEFTTVLIEYRHLSEARCFRKLNDNERAKFDELEAKLEAIAGLE